MAIRTTDTKVKKLLDYDEDIDVEQHIETASALVDEVCVPLGYDATRLELIERWLAAHFYSVQDPRVTNEKAGISASYEGQAAMSFDFTRYGQQAKLLDTKGGLAGLQNAQKVKTTIKPGVLFVGGNPPGDQYNEGVPESEA